MMMIENGIFFVPRHEVGFVLRDLELDGFRVLGIEEYGNPVFLAIHTATMY